MKQAEGVGSRAPDGSWVELYLRLHSFGEADVIDAAIRPRSSILELGAGTGRMTHELLAKGHHVVAVDQSAEMLNHVRGAEKVLSDIETLELDRTFDAVVLASNLVNTPDSEQRSDFLRTCSRHVDARGSVFIQRYPPYWEPSEGLQTEREGVSILLRDIRKSGRFLSATVVYESDDRRWSQQFLAQLLDDGELQEMLEAPGLLLDGSLDSEGSWVQAKLIQTEASTNG